MGTDKHENWQAAEAKIITIIICLVACIVLLEEHVIKHNLQHSNWFMPVRISAHKTYLLKARKITNATPSTSAVIVWGL